VEKQPGQEDLSEGAQVTIEVLEAIIKARKLFKLYPPNNPIYIKAADTVFEKFSGFFHLDESLKLKIARNQIFYASEVVYHNLEKDDNLALFLFKDGIRELTFNRDVSHEELDEFLRVMSIDFDKDAPDDDIVTVLWEKDFEHIKFYADDFILTDDELSDELKDAEKIRGNAFTDDNLKKAYHSSLDEIPDIEYILTPLTQEELQHISEDLESQDRLKVEKFITILFELLSLTQKSESIRNIVRSMKEILGYCVKRGDFRNASYALSRLNQALQEGVIGKNNAAVFEPVFVTANSGPLISMIGEVMESTMTINEADYLDFIKHLNKNAIKPFMRLLDELASVKKRSLVVETLTIIGKEDVTTVATGLKAGRWNVVRDTLLILGNIGTADALENIVDILSHSDDRVRREAVRTVGRIEHRDTYLYLSKSLDDTSSSIRMVAARQLANIRTDEVKKIFLSAVSERGFASREFNEKKVFYGIITNWPDQEVKDFLTRTLRSTKIWRRTRHDETRACAAHALGVLMDRDSIPLLSKTSKAKNRTLRESSIMAIKKITA
jgi:hypothetical protein